MHSKADRFAPDLAGLAAFARALSHPARLTILQTLAARGTCVCGEVVEVLPLAQATVSQHLKALKEAGLIRGETDGPRSCYGLDAEAVTRAADALAAFAADLREAAARSEGCC